MRTRHLRNSRRRCYGFGASAAFTFRVELQTVVRVPERLERRVTHAGRQTVPTLPVFVERLVTQRGCRQMRTSFFVRLEMRSTQRGVQAVERCSIAPAALRTVVV